MPESRGCTYLICNVHGPYEDEALAAWLVPVWLPTFCREDWDSDDEDAADADDDDDDDDADDDCCWPLLFSVAWYAWKRSSAINVVRSTVSMWSSRTRTHDTDLLNTIFTCKNKNKMTIKKEEEQIPDQMDVNVVAYEKLCNCMFECRQSVRWWYWNVHAFQIHPISVVRTIVIYVPLNGGKAYRPRPYIPSTQWTERKKNKN